MESPNRPYLPQVDELRAFAAMLVLLFHCLIIGYWQQGHTGWIMVQNPLEALVVEGHSGVALFMVLSGFILALGVWDRAVNYLAFIRNRIVRIVPLMTVLTIFAVYSTKDIRLTNVLAPFWLLQNALPLALNDPAGLMGTAWTISVEFQFYLVAPFLFLFVGRYRPIEFVIPLALFVIFLRALVLIVNKGDSTFLWQFPAFSIAGHFNQFVFGILLARNWQNIVFLAQDREIAVGSALVMAGLVGMMTLSQIENVEGGQYVWRWWRTVLPEIEGVLWLLFIAGYILLNPLRMISKAQSAIKYIGTISFSIYLLHWPIMLAVYRTIPTFGITIPETLWGVAALATFLIGPAVIFVASLSYFSIERPFLQLRGRYVQQ